jgi:hypothetical protein
VRDPEQLTSRLTTALSDAGVLVPGAEDRARDAVRAALVGTATGPARRTGGSRMAEVAGYLGAALVAGALAVLFADQWGHLSTTAQVAILLAVAAAAGFAGWKLAPRGPGSSSLVRLASALSVVAAGASAGAAGVVVDAAGGDPAWAWLAAGALGALVAAAGWLLAPTLLGQVAMFAGAATAITSGVALIDPDQWAWYPAAVLVTAAAWLAVNELRRRPEVTAVRVLALGTILVTVQAAGYAMDVRWAPYVLTLIAAAAAFLLYAGPVRGWPYVAFAVAGVLLAVPEALFDLTDSHVGAAFALAATGALVLGAATLALRPARSR